MNHIVKWKGKDYEFKIDLVNNILYVREVIKETQLELFPKPKNDNEDNILNWDYSTTLEQFLYEIYQKRDDYEGDDYEDDD